MTGEQFLDAYSIANDLAYTDGVAGKRMVAAILGKQRLKYLTHQVNNGHIVWGDTIFNGQVLEDIAADLLTQISSQFDMVCEEVFNTLQKAADSVGQEGKGTVECFLTASLTDGDFHFHFDNDVLSSTCYDPQNPDQLLIN